MNNFVESEKLCDFRTEKSNYLFGFLDIRFIRDVTSDWQTLKNVDECENNLYLNVTHIVNMNREIQVDLFEEWELQDINQYFDIHT